jgi:hypothetical protein
MQKRVSVYIDEKDHNKMKAELASRGLTLSEWLRQQIAKFLRVLEGENEH